MRSLKSTKIESTKINNSIIFDLPESMRLNISKLPENKREEFLLDYKKKKKSLKTAYFLLSVFIGPYLGYLNKWWLQLLHWITFGGYVFWWLINIFYLPRLVLNYNNKLAHKLINEIDKPYLTTDYVIKTIKDKSNFEFQYIEVNKRKIYLFINNIKFRLILKDKDIIWSIVIPGSFYFFVILIFALFSLIVTSIVSGSPWIVLLGVGPGGLLSYTLYRWKPSVFKERRKLLILLYKIF